MRYEDGEAGMLINGRFLTRPASGVDRFASELVRALAHRQGGAVDVAVPRGAAHTDKLPVEAGRLQVLGERQGQWWEQVELPKASGDRPLVNLANAAPLVRARQLVVIHDAATLANPHNFSLAFRSWYRFMLAGLMRRSDVIASVSKFSADELTRLMGRRARGIEVIGEGGEHILRQPADPSMLERLDLHGRRFVLAVGNRSPNKNFSGVVRALEQLDDPDVLLVAVGGGNDRVFAASDEAASARMRRTGYVSDAQLRALYEHATCFIFPSFYEGFGLPPLEAMCCGCPVISSDRSSLPEVCGDAVLYCDPADPASIANALRRLLNSPALQQELREAGHRQAARHGWDRAAQDFLDIYKAGFQ